MIRKIKPKKIDGVIKVDAHIVRNKKSDTINIKIRDIENNYYYGFCEFNIKHVK